MKKIIISIISIVSLPLSAQVGSEALSLNQLKDSALQHNIAIRTAQHDIEAAQQQRKEAFTKYFPNVSGTAMTFNANRGMAKMNVDPQEYIPTSMAASLAQILPPEMLAGLAEPISLSMMKSGTIASLMAVQPLFAGGQIVNGNKLAKVGEDVSRLQLRLKEQEVERQTEQYYWQLVSLQEKMHTVDAAEALLTDIHNDVSVAVRAGVALRNDLLQVELRQNDIKSQRLKLQNAIDLMKMLLAQYCGLTTHPQPLPEMEGSGYTFNILMPDMTQQDNTLSSPSSYSKESSRQIEERSKFKVPLGFAASLCEESSKLKGLPEYQLLSQQVEAARLQKKMAVGQNLPTVAVGAGYNYHNLLDNDRTFAMVFATVSIPISDWWGGSHAVKRRNIELQQAVDQQDDAAQLLLIRMQKAANDVSEARQQLLLARQGMEQAEENLRLIRDRYRAGTTTMSDLLEAQLLAQQAHDKATDAYADLQQRLLDYRQATGE